MKKMKKNEMESPKKTEANEHMEKSPNCKMRNAQCTLRLGVGSDSNHGRQWGGGGVNVNGGEGVDMYY